MRLKSHGNSNRNCPHGFTDASFRSTLEGLTRLVFIPLEENIGQFAKLTGLQWQKSTAHRVPFTWPRKGASPKARASFPVPAGSASFFHETPKGSS